jgi:large subunit ribosomal protein L10
MPTQAKADAIENLIREFSDARSLILADFAGMDVATVSELRRRCHDEKVRFRVAKNTLMIRAIDSIGLEALRPMFRGPTGYAIAKDDELAAARVLVAFAKEKQLPKVKGGMVEGKVYSLEEIMALAVLPPRDELIGQLLMTMEAPVSQVISGLSGLASDLVSILDQLSERQGEGAPAKEEASAPASGEGAGEAASAESAEGAGGEASAESAASAGGEASAESAASAEGESPPDEAAEKPSV